MAHPFPSDCARGKSVARAELQRLQRVYQGAGRAQPGGPAWHFCWLTRYSGTEVAKECRDPRWSRSTLDTDAGSLDEGFVGLQEQAAL